MSMFLNFDLIKSLEKAKIHFTEYKKMQNMSLKIALEKLVQHDCRMNIQMLIDRNNNL